MTLHPTPVLKDLSCPLCLDISSTIYAPPNQNHLLTTPSMTPLANTSISMESRGNFQPTRPSSLSWRKRWPTWAMTSQHNWREHFPRLYWTGRLERWLAFIKNEGQAYNSQPYGTHKTIMSFLCLPRGYFDQFWGFFIDEMSFQCCTSISNYWHRATVTDKVRI